MTLTGGSGWPDRRLRPNLGALGLGQPSGLLGLGLGLLLWLAGATAGLGAVGLPLRWRFSNPVPHGNNIVEMAYLPGSPGLWVQVAERGQLYTSSDFDLWIPRATGTTHALRGAAFLGQRLIVVGACGTVLYADALDRVQRGTLSDNNTNDWLEAVAASPTLAVAVGDAGAIYTTTNGAFWQRQNAGISTWLTGVAYGAGTFVAVGDAGFIATSPNGSTWTPRTSGTTVDLNRVAYLGGSRFMAVGRGGLSLMSSNAGVSWSQDRCGATNDLYSAAALATARLVCGRNEVWLNETGSWSNQLARPGGPPAWTYYTSLGQGSVWTLAGQTGLMVEGYKTNWAPVLWQMPFDSVRHWLWDVVRVADLYVAVGDRATVLTSGDGVNWALELVPEAVTNSIFLGVGGSTNLLVAVGDAGSIMISPNLATNIPMADGTGSGSGSTNRLTSSLGVIWFALPRLGTNDLQGVAYGQGLYVVTGAKGLVFTSRNGTNWARQTTPLTKFLSSVTAWPGGFVASGDDGALLTSADGTNWTVRSSGTTNWLYRVRYLGSNLIAVGQNGTIRTSPDGVNWVARSSGTSRWLTDVTLIADTYFVVGQGGTVLASTNLAHWTAVGTITLKDLYAAATDSRQLVVVGVEGLILRSPVLADLTPISILRYARLKSADGLWAENLFLFAGKPDQRFTLDYRADLGTNSWTAGPQLEFYSSDGTLYYLETLPASNAPPQEFYRATLLP